MHRQVPERRTPLAQWWCWYLLLVVLALVPWFRNHHFLRSFFDYGVVIGGIGRIDVGQQPYVDFVTPIQTGWYYLNRIAEKIGGGTFQGMTLAGAGSIVLAAAGMFLMLARRWGVISAAVVAGSLTFATVAQHTILWYNPWGVVLLCVVVWAGAVAPVLRRADALWHALAFVALFLGGINKINMQLMALSIAIAWAMRAGLTGVASWKRVLATIGFYFVPAGLAILAEMWWTGASFEVWWHNVVALPGANRSNIVLAALSTDFLLKPLHDYYGLQWLKPVGLVGVLATILTVGGILRKTWRQTGIIEKFLPIGCGLISILGGMVLLTTNMDISYIGLGGWLGLLVGLWLGYDMPTRGGCFYTGLIFPIAIVGVVAWQSAWTGQRSQFGHSLASRAQYVPGDQSDADFHYLKGTMIPPEMGESLGLMAKWRRDLSPERRAHILYGPGTEMAAHFWPALETPGLPLYQIAGISVGLQEATRLERLIRSDQVEAIMVSRVLDNWVQPERSTLEHHFDKISLGGVFSVYDKIAERGVSSRPVRFTREFGGSTDPRHLISKAQFFTLSNNRMMLGFSKGTGTMLVDVPTNRMQGEVVLRRLDKTFQGKLQAEFSIYAQGDATTRYERWRKTVELAPGSDEIIVHYAIDSSHLPTTFEVTVPPEYSGKLAAGWEGPHIMHSGLPGPEKPSWLYRSGGAGQLLDEAALARLLSTDWRPQVAYMRKGRVTSEGIELLPGGEIWMRVKSGIKRLDGKAWIDAGRSNDAQYLPVVRGMWYRGGRLEHFSDQPVRAADRTAEVFAWCAEPGGWLVIGVDPSFTAWPVTVRIDKASDL